jgi:predicted secreted protein
MTWVTGLLIYVVIWWMVLFTVLPFGHRPQEDPEPGTPESAPAQPRILLKFLVTTVIAGLIWLGFRVYMEYDPFGLVDYLRGTR